MSIQKILAGACLMVGLVGCSGGSEQVSSNNKSWSLIMADSHGLGDFDCNTKHKDSLSTTAWDYVSGLVANSLLEAWRLHPEREDLFYAVRAYADLATSADGLSITKYEGKPALGPSNIDDLAAAKIYFDLYNKSLADGDTARARRYRVAATMVRNKLKYEHNRIAADLPGAGGFWHKLRYPNQMWLDGLFMGPAVYARWQGEWGEQEEGHEANMASWSDIALQFKTLFEHTYDKKERLNYHGWSATPDAPDSYWAAKEGENKGCSPEFWGRAMGWYFAALVDILEWMPKDHPDYPVLTKMLQQTAKDLALRQDKKTGLWYNLLRYDDSVAADGKGDVIDGETYNVGTRRNYTESSASAMFAYVYMKGARLGLLDAEDKAVGVRAFEGLLANKVVDEGNGKIGIKDICASAGLGPASDKGRCGTINYYLEGSDTKLVKANEGKGVGTFIFAAAEYERLNSK